MAPREQAEVVGSAVVGLPEPTPPLHDRESREWVRALRAGGAEGDAALARLHAHLLRAARHEVARRRPAMPDLRGDESGDIATEAADDALMAILRRLDDFRGESRFTTWAWKFAVLHAATRLRRRAWQGRELPLSPERWERLPALAPDPADEAETAELLGAVAATMRDDLTARQREVLVALAIDGVPIDVLAERRGTTRGALYKTLHDARRRLRAGLAARGQTAPGGAP